MKRIVETVQELLLPYLHEQGVYADFTMGNGHDTLFLASHTRAEVYAFDIQPSALQATRRLLEEHGIQNVRLILDSHDRMREYLPGPLDAGIFNLGYLPGGDKGITTQAGTTLRAVQQAVELLRPGGLLAIVLYPGHEAGLPESQAVEAYCRTLDSRDYDVVKYDFLNRRRPPYLIAVERRNKRGKQHQGQREEP